MKFLLTLFAILLVTVLVANIAITEPGYVLLSYGKTSLELPLVDFLVALLAVILVSYLLIRFLLGLRRTPSEIKRLREQQQNSKSRKHLLQGLIEMAEGKWGLAEKHLIGSAKNSDLPVLSYLAAAHAAQRQKGSDRRDDYLRMASNADPKAEVAIGLAQAELQIQEKQFEEALATLKHLEQKAPKHRFVKKLLGRLYYKMQDWENLSGLIPTLRKQNAVSETELSEFETSTYVSKLNLATDSESADTIWQTLNKETRNNVNLIRSYAKTLIQYQDSKQAEELLRKALNKNWHDALAETYGSLQFKDSQIALNHAGKWLEADSKNPVLLAAVGRLSSNSHLWGKARSLLRESIHIKPTAVAYQALAELQDHLNEPESAKESYEAGFKLLADRISNDF